MSQIEAINITNEHYNGDEFEWYCIWQYLQRNLSSTALNQMILFIYPFQSKKVIATIKVK